MDAITSFKASSMGHFRFLFSDRIISSLFRFLSSEKKTTNKKRQISIHLSAGTVIYQTTKYKAYQEGLDECNVNAMLRFADRQHNPYDLYSPFY